VVSPWDELDEQEKRSDPVRRKPRWAVKAVSGLVFVAITVSLGVHHDGVPFGIGLAVITFVSIGTVGMFLEQRRSRESP
jgi:hypothetical protein